MAHMYVVVPSNSSMEYFPDNTLADFKVKLGKALVLEGDYEVGLSEIIYPHRRLTVQPLDASMTVHYWKRSRVTGHEKKLQSEKKFTNDLESGKLKRKKYRLLKFASKSILPAAIYETPDVLLNALQEMRSEKLVDFAFTNGRFDIKFGNEVNRVDLSARLANLLGFSKYEEPFTIHTPGRAVFEPHWEGSTHSLYIYSSIVDHQLVGDVVAPLLRVVCPDAERLGQTVSEKYIRPNYLPVNSNYIDTIDVQIRTTSGHLFPFLSGTPVVLSLHFRPRK